MQQRMSAEPGDYPDSPMPVRKGALVIDLGKRRGAVGKKLRGSGDGGETVASWNAANPTHPRDAKGRFAETAGAAAGAVGDLLRSMVKEHGGERTKLGKALMDMVGPGKVDTPDLGGSAPESVLGGRDAATKLRHAEAMFGSDRSKWTAAQRRQAEKLEGKAPAAKPLRVKPGTEEQVKRLDELNALSAPTAKDEAEFDKILSGMTVAQMKAWLNERGRTVHNPGKKDAFRQSIVNSLIGSKRDRNAILYGGYSSGIGPTDEQVKGAETAARLRSALASIQDGGLNEANEADFRKHLSEMTPAELDKFRKEHDIPGAGGLAIKANAIKIFIEGRKRTQSVMRVEELADRQLAGHAKGAGKLPEESVLQGMTVPALRELYKELTGIESKPSAMRTKKDVIAALKHDVGMGNMFERESKAWNATMEANAKRASDIKAADDADFAKFQADREAVRAPKMSSNPRKRNTWGGVQEPGAHTFHPDGVIGGLIGGGRPGDWATIPADQRKLQVRGDSLENVLGDLATNTMAGRVSPMEQVEQMAQIASELPPGAAKDALRKAVDMLDVPKVDMQARLSDGGREAYGRFPGVAGLVRALNDIPLARGAEIRGERADTRELDKITAALNAFGEGKLGGLRFISAIEEVRNIRHESREGKAAIDRAVNEAIEKLNRQFKEEREAFYPPKPGA